MDEYVVAQVRRSRRPTERDMRMIRFSFFMLLILQAGSFAVEPKDFPLDPVAYTCGQETPGKEDLLIVRGNYRYKFADASNKAVFEKEPERYEIQLGGACARMGPLNPPEAAEFYALHAGKI